MREKSYKDNYNSQPNKYRGGETKVMKKILNLALVFALLLTMVTPAFAASTTEELGKYEDAVTRLASLGVLTGEGDGSFNVDDTITRAEFTAMAVRVLGMEEAAKVSSGATPFKDGVAPWASGYVNVAVNQGIVTGYADGRFGEKDAVTQAQVLAMLVRALGYDPVVSKEGWPTNYIVKAIDLGLTEGVDNVSAYAPAKRGDVFQMADNALTVAKMIQIGYGTDTKFVVSGAKGTDTDKVTLLSDNLGIEDVTAVVTDIPRTNSKLDDNEIKVGDEVLEVGEGFDFEAVLGLEVTAYVDNSKVIDLVVEEEALYDAVEYDSVKGELKLVQADETYEFALDKDSNVAATIYIDGAKKSETDLSAAYGYGKVALDDEGDVKFLEVYTWDDFLVVEELDEEVVFAYGEELDLEDYILVKEGKTIATGDLVEGDILFFNESAEYAEVYNDSLTGEIERIYSDSFDVDSDEYDFGNAVYVKATAQYLNGSSLADMTTTVADAMKDEGAVTLYFDREGNLVFVSGELGEEVTSSFLAYVTSVGAPYDSRSGQLNPIDVLTEAGEEVAYDFKTTDVTDADFFTAENVAEDWSDVAAGSLLEIEVDADGDVKTVTLLDVKTSDATADTKYFATDDRFVSGYKLSSSAVVFVTENYTTDVDDIEVTTFGELDFDNINQAEVFVNSNDAVIALVVSETDRDSDVTSYKAVATTDSQEFASGGTWKLTLVVNGVEKVYYTEAGEDVLDTVGGTVYAGDFLTVDIDDTSSDITSVSVLTKATDPSVVDEDTIDANGVNVKDRELVINGITYYVADATILDSTDSYAEISIRDLAAGDNVELYLAADGSKYVTYVIKK